MDFRNLRDNILAEANNVFDFIILLLKQEAIEWIFTIDDCIMNRNRALAHSNKWYFGIG
jgi:hypothetical protein